VVILRGVCGEYYMNYNKLKHVKNKKESLWTCMGGIYAIQQNANGV
jgi:hypothetical protein